MSSLSLLVGRMGTAMNLGMGRLGKGHKVLWAVVRGVAVDVVDMLIRLQQAAMHLFPNQAMLKHIAIGVGRRMVWDMNVPATTREIAPTFPGMALAPALPAHAMAMNIGFAIRGAAILLFTITISISHLLDTSTGAKCPRSNAMKREWDITMMSLRHSGIMAKHKANGLPLDITETLTIVLSNWSRLATSTLAQGYHTSPLGLVVIV